MRESFFCLFVWWWGRKINLVTLLYIFSKNQLYLGIQSYWWSTSNSWVFKAGKVWTELLGNITGIILLILEVQWISGKSLRLPHFLAVLCCTFYFHKVTSYHHAELERRCWAGYQHHLLTIWKINSVGYQGSPLKKSELAKSKVC